MMGGGAGGWVGPLMMMIIWVIILALAVAAVVWFVRSTTHATTYPPQRMGRSRGLELLEERYARGEINREEYMQKKADLS